MESIMHNTFVRVSVTTIALANTLAVGQVFLEDYKIIPDDISIRDRFGSKAAISGNIAVITRDREDYFRGEIAFLLDAETGHVLSLIDGPCFGCSYEFACDVDIDDDTVIIGARRYEHPDVSTFPIGAAFLYDITTGEQRARLLPEEPFVPYGTFGESVSISGDKAVVGDTSGRIGSAYVFDATTGQQLARLSPSDGEWSQSFGDAVAIHLDTIAVANSTDTDQGFDSGSVYLFDATTGEERHKILPTDGNLFDRFGSSIALSGSTLVVGAPFDDDNGEDSGSAYLFNIETGQQIAKLLPSDGAAIENFGNSVAIDGDIVVVGASRDNTQSGNGSGSVYLFSATTGQQTSKIHASDGDQGDAFGHTVAISGDVLVVGARHDEEREYRAGSAYILSIPQCDADLTGDGQMSFFDVSAFIAAFSAQDPIADFTNDGSFDFFDVSAFLTEYANGCP